MNSVKTKDLVDNFKVSLKNYPQDCNSLVKLCSKSIHYILSDGFEGKFYPRFGSIKSNIKGEYFVIFCDSCNSKCRKVYIKTLTFESKNIIKFLCFRCAGVSGVEPTENAENTTKSGNEAMQKTIWWARRESNPHSLNENWILSPTCLPFHHSPVMILWRTRQELNLRPLP